MDATTRDEGRRALVDPVTALEAAPVGWRPPGTLIAERLEAGRAWLDDLRRAVGRAAARLPEHRAARLRTFRDQLDREVSLTASEPPPGWADGVHGSRPRVERALRAVPLAVNALESAARETRDALDREERAEVRRAEAPVAAAVAPLPKDPPPPPAANDDPLEDRLVALAATRRAEEPWTWSRQLLANAVRMNASTLTDGLRRILARDLSMSASAKVEDLRRAVAALDRASRNRLTAAGSFAARHFAAAADRPRPTPRKRQARAERDRDDVTRAEVERWSDASDE